MSPAESSVNGHPPRGPEANRRVARELGFRGANHLYVMGPDNDPFAIGREKVGIVGESGSGK